MKKVQIEIREINGEVQFEFVNFGFTNEELDTLTKIVRTKTFLNAVKEKDYQVAEICAFSLHEPTTLGDNNSDV